MDFVLKFHEKHILYCKFGLLSKSDNIISIPDDIPASSIVDDEDLPLKVLQETVGTFSKAVPSAGPLGKSLLSPSQREFILNEVEKMGLHPNKPGYNESHR